MIERICTNKHSLMANNNNNTSSSTQQMADSLCIPRAFPNITKERVWAIFCKAGFGHLDHIDEVLKEDSHGRKFKRFYIHFKEWAEGWEQHRLLLLKDAGEYLKVTYDSKGPNGGWFWKVYANRATKHEKRDDKVVVQLASKVDIREEAFPKLECRNSKADNDFSASFSTKEIEISEDEDEDDE